MRFLFYVCLCFFLWVPLQSEEAWDLEYQNSTVSVFGRAVSYCRYREFKSVTTVDYPLRQVFNVFTNFHDYDKWFGYCIDSYTVRRHSEREHTVFLLIDTPWPITDKYLLTDIYLDDSFGDGKAEIRFGLSENSYNIKSGQYEPVDKLTGICSIESRGTWQTEVTFICAMDPGGNIPVLFIEKFQLDQMVKTAVNLHKQLEFFSDLSPGIPQGNRLVADY